MRRFTDTLEFYHHCAGLEANVAEFESLGGSVSFRHKCTSVVCGALKLFVPVLGRVVQEEGAPMQVTVMPLTVFIHRCFALAPALFAGYFYATGERSGDQP